MDISNKQLKTSYDLAYEMEKSYGGWAQCVLAAVKETLGNIDNSVIKAASGLAGGIGLTGNTCGALLGGVMALSSFIGRDYENNFSDPQKNMQKSFRNASKLIERYQQEYGSVSCKEIQQILMGESFNLMTKDGYDAFVKAGGRDNQCTSVCGNTAKWVLEILDKQGAIPSGN